MRHNGVPLPQAERDLTQDTGSQLARSQDIAAKVAVVYGKRAQHAHDTFLAQQLASR